MGREKNLRNITFKPTFKSYIPENIEQNGVTILLDEEMEALYLMDVLDVYQEEAAISMGISRPTFTRILKNARQKLTNALISGHKISIQDGKLEFNIAICTKYKTSDQYSYITPTEKYIQIFTISNGKIELIKIIDNPVYNSDNKPAMVLPELFLNYKINIFISSKIGEGLKNSLISKGIHPIIKENFDLSDLSTTN